MWQFFRELLASAVLTGTVGRFACVVVPPPYFVLMPTLLFTPFIVRDFAKMDADLVSAYSNVATAVVAVIGAIIAGIGVSAWRQKLIGENEYQLSVRLQELLFQIQKEVRAIRRNHSLADRTSHFAERMSAPGGDFDTLTLKGRAHWGDEYHELVVPVQDAINELRHELDLDANTPSAYKQKHFERIHEVTHGNEQETDAFSVKWNKAFKELETFLKQYIKK